MKNLPKLSIMIAKNQKVLITEGGFVMKNAIITISRQYGSGGRKIAEELAKKMNIPFYDNELISMAAEKSGIRMNAFEDAEMQAGNFLYRLARLGPETQM